MRSLAQPRQKSITLKEYMHNASLRKRLNSRTNSRQKRQLLERDGDAYPLADLHKLNRDKLIDQIKLYLAKVIKNQSILAEILKMFNRLIELYKNELHIKQRENGLLETMIQEQTSLTNTQTRRIDETNFKMNTLQPYKNPTQQNTKDFFEPDKSRKNSVEIHHYRNSSSASSEQIPNINVLLMTRNEPLFEKIRDQQTEQTLIDSPNHEEEESKISIEINQSKDEETSFIHNTLINSSAYNRILAGLNKKEEPPTNTSIHSTLWKKCHNPQNNVLSRFEELKRKMDK